MLIFKNIKWDSYAFAAVKTDRSIFQELSEIRRIKIVTFCSFWSQFTRFTLELFIKKLRNFLLPDVRQIFFLRSTIWELGISII